MNQESCKTKRLGSQLLQLTQIDLILSSVHFENGGALNCIPRLIKSSAAVREPEREFALLSTLLKSIGTVR